MLCSLTTPVKTVLCVNDALSRNCKMMKFTFEFLVPVLNCFDYEHHAIYLNELETTDLYFFLGPESLQTQEFYI